LNCGLEKWGVPEGGDMNKLFRLVKRGKALTHIITGKREAIPVSRLYRGSEPV